MKLFRDPVVLLFSLIGLAFLLGAGLYGHYLWTISSHWPRVDAIIQESKLSSARGNYRGEVVVSYRAAGQEYQTTITSGISSGSADLVRKELAEYPPQEHCMLPLNPDNPQDVRLKPGTGEAILVGGLALGGLLFILIPVGVVALSRRQDAIRLTGFTFMAIGALFGLLGLALGWTRVQVLRNWPSTDATVVSSSMGGGLKRHWLLVEFSYEVAGKPYQVRTGSSWSTTSAASVEDSVRFYAPGSHHPVHYRADAPDVIDFESAWSLATFWPAAVALLVGASTTLLGFLVTRHLGQP